MQAKQQVSLKNLQGKYRAKQVAHLMKKAKEECDNNTQEEQYWTFKNMTYATKLIEYLTMTKDFRIVV
jgi:hypothetical protein